MLRRRGGGRGEEGQTKDEVRRQLALLAGMRRLGKRKGSTETLEERYRGTV